MFRLLSYEREPINSVLYDPRLAYSMHLAISADGASFVPLNHNSGILFAKATENSDGSLNPRTLRHPLLYKAGNAGYRVLATVGGPEGETDSKLLYALYETGNFVEYTLLAEGEKESPAIKEALERVSENLPKETPDIEGISPCNMIDIDDKLGEYLLKKFITPHNTGIELPEFVYASSSEDLKGLKAVSKYSDGTTHIKPVVWDDSKVNYEVPGIYEVKGTVKLDHYDFPVAYDRADPCVGYWKDKFYFIATNDADNNHTLYIREADTIPELISSEEHLILDSTTYPEIGNLLWAPEFHEIEGRMFIFHAATPEPFFSEESHVMELKEGGNACNKEDWCRPKRVVRMDGSDICEAGKEITLDMTCFNWEGEYYVIWSQRQFLPKDLGAWLYIAKLNKDEPWKLASEPVVLSKPDYSWGNNHTFVEEGPFALISGEKLFVSFSAAAIDTSYVVGLLSIEKGLDPLNPLNWKKKGYPILTSRSVPGEYGTGHNAYVTDRDGNIYNTYHGRPGTDAPRSSGIRRVHFDIDGEPVLDLTEQLDLSDEFKNVSVKVIVR